MAKAQWLLNPASPKPLNIESFPHEHIGNRHASIYIRIGIVDFMGEIKVKFLSVGMSSTTFNTLYFSPKCNHNGEESSQSLDSFSLMNSNSQPSTYDQ